MYWIAPELLRQVGSPINGTPKGDVYSFAIIMWELMYNSKAGPYQDINLDPKGWHDFLTVLTYKFFVNAQNQLLLVSYNLQLYLSSGNLAPLEAFLLPFSFAL